MYVLLAGTYKMGERGMGMDGYKMQQSPFGVVHLVVAVITWVAVVSVLFAAARLLWKKGNKVK